MWKPTGLLLGPGGIKGFMELGFLLYMEKHGLLDRFDTFVGISVGAIISLLLVAGYSVYEIINEASRTNILGDVGLIHLSDIKENAGLLSHQKLREVLENLIVAKFGKVLSMKELYQATGIELHITSLKLDEYNPQPVHFSHLVESEISCVEAAILSANIPFIFKRLYYKGKCYVDGALGAPYPIHLIDNGQRDVLGLYVQSVFDNQDGILGYFRQVFYAGMVQLRNESIKHASSRCRHVALRSNNPDLVGFTTSSEAKINMITEGYEIARKFFEQDYSSLVVSASNIEKIEASS
jgi:predicted acylesterase/phospholipase RssA